MLNKGVLSLPCCHCVQRRGSIWARVGMLTASDLSSGDKFGYSLSIARDCVLAIGAPTAVGFGATSGAVRHNGNKVAHADTTLSGFLLTPRPLCPAESGSTMSFLCQSCEHSFGVMSCQAYVFSPAQPCGNWTQAAKLSPRVSSFGWTSPHPYS